MEWGPLEGLDNSGTDRPWMDLKNQPGFAQRAQMIADLVELVLALKTSSPVSNSLSVTSSLLSVTDLGCGDGSLLELLQLGWRAWGYEIGSGDVEHAQSRGLDVRQRNIITDRLEYGDVIIASEVLEHIAEPVKFLRALPADSTLIISSPSRETGEWHNPIHTWAWDLAGYWELTEKSGWVPVYQTECSGGVNDFGGVQREQFFQAIVAVR